MKLASSRDYKEEHSSTARYSVSTRYDGCNTLGYIIVKSREMTSLRTLEIFIGAGVIEYFTPSTLESEAGGSL